jgi:aryl-alcohol dehydrogenase-like predicted oxidoreductase
MLSRLLGSTGLSVSALGLGTGRLGEDDVTEEDAEALLLGALDLGITLLDTARSYGLAEERIGRYLSHRRTDFVLVTKGGYGVDLVPDWTHAAVTRGIERALSVMKTDYLDVFLLHSCPKSVALRDDIMEALDRAVSAGKVRAAGYSGDGDALGAAVRSGRFSCAECSVSLFDQKNLDAIIPSAEARGVGVIAKRALGNAVFTMRFWPEGEHADYWQRMQAMQLAVPRGGWVDLAVRFSAFAPGVSAALVGTRDLAHLEEAVDSVARGDLEPDARARISVTFATKNQGWEGKV